MNRKPVVTYNGDLKISSFVPHTEVTASGILFSVAVPEGKSASLLLYEKGREKVMAEIPFPQNPEFGRIFRMHVEGISADEIEYNYKIGGKIVTDPAAQIVRGLEPFGAKSERSPHRIRGGFINMDFDWNGDKPLKIPYRDSIFYELHVRGFTRHRNAKVKHKGTYSGLIEKIPYLKELGITAVVLLPAYEFDEIIEDDGRLGWRPEGLRELLAGNALPPSAMLMPSDIASKESAAYKSDAAGDKSEKTDSDKSVEKAEKIEKTDPDKNGNKAEKIRKTGPEESEKKTGKTGEEAREKGKKSGEDTSGEAESKTVGYTAENDEPKTAKTSSGKVKKEQEVRLNYWGFGAGWFFAPKSSYSSSPDAADEFRLMVRSLHEAGIEVIMEMSFPEGTDISFMRASLLWWRQVYHIDGFYLMGSQDEINSAVKSAALCDIKFFSDYFDTKKLYPKGRPFAFRNLAECNPGFRTDARQLLKGNENQLRAFVERTRYNPKDSAVVNTICSHNGFTLMDLVSYNDKHNEDNGEQNHDGAPTEYSWNCGVEGPCRRRDITRLRVRQIKNAYAMMLLAQGTPMILAGDEMGNSQHGNSNAYCTDSELTWLEWQNTKLSQELSSFLKKLIVFRKEHAVLHSEKELTGTNSGGFFPDFSCHGNNAWFASFDQQDRSIGLMYSNRIKPGGPEDNGGNADAVEFSYIYVAYNFHWREQKLALPYLPQGRKWHVALNTGEDCVCAKDDEKEAEVKYIEVPGRTVIVLEG